MKVINTNLNSAFFTCQAVIGSMREQCYDCIVNIAFSSIRGNVRPQERHEFYDYE